MDGVHHSVDLDMTYKVRGRKRMRLVFEDGVSYTLEEALLAARLADVPPSRRDDAADDLRGLHAIKQAFGGVITGGPSGPGAPEPSIHTPPPTDGGKTPAGGRLVTKSLPDCVQTSLW